MPAERSHALLDVLAKEIPAMQPYLMSHERRAVEKAQVETFLRTRAQTIYDCLAARFPKHAPRIKEPLLKITDAEKLSQLTTLVATATMKQFAAAVQA